MNKTTRVDVFISAENPNYQIISPARNRERMKNLHDYLYTLNYSFALDLEVYPAKYIDKSSGYTENSFFVKNIPLMLSIQLAQGFGQASIVIDGIGLLDVRRMVLAPQLKKYVGEKAKRRSAYSIINGDRYVSYDFDFENQRPFVL